MVKIYYEEKIGIDFKLKSGKTIEIRNGENNLDDSDWKDLEEEYQSFIEPRLGRIFVVLYDNETVEEAPKPVKKKKGK